MAEQHDAQQTAEHEAAASDAAYAPASHAASPRDARRHAKQQRRLEALERTQLHRAERAARGPGPWRTWVLPSLRLVVVAAIAIALVKLAFFPSGEPAVAEDPMAGAVFEEPLAAVERGSIENAVSLDGTVVPVEAVPVRPSKTGVVHRVYVEDGVQVAQGDVLYTVRVETQAEPDEEGMIGEPVVTIWNVRAPATGSLTGFELLPDQGVDLASPTGAVQPPRYLVQSSVGAAQQYRLTTQPETATVTIDSGPAPFECTDVVIRQPSGEEVTAGASATLTCAVPEDVRVFVGLAAQLELAAGSADDVLLLPTTAVLGSADVGLAYLPTASADGTPAEPEEVRLELGLSDGTMVEVRSGLSEGDEVLQFVPGAADPCADPATADPMVCGFGSGFMP